MQKLYSLLAALELLDGSPISVGETIYKFDGTTRAVAWADGIWNLELGCVPFPVDDNLGYQAVVEAAIGGCWATLESDLTLESLLAQSAEQIFKRTDWSIVDAR